MEKRYRVTLTDEERQELRAMVSTGKAAARKLVRARVLLLADQAEGGPAKSDREIVEALGCGRATVERVRQQVVEEGLEEVLQPKPSARVYERRWDGKAEAHLVALACGAPPEGRSRWTLRLLGDRLVALGHVESVAHETVRRTLKKKRTSTLAEERMVFAGKSVRRFCRFDGRRVGGLPPPLQRPSSRGLPG